MAKKTIITAFILLFVATTYSQNLTFIQSDKDTYQKYLEKDWKGLIKAGKLAKKNNLNYYYLNVRMGVAYFELKKYFLAANYFQKAYKENPKDAYVLDMLYYSYLYSGQINKSYSIYEKMLATDKKQKNITSRPTKSIDILAGHHQNLDFYDFNDKDFLESDMDKVIVKLDKSITSFDFGWNSQIADNVTFYNKVSYRNARFLYVEQNSYNVRDMLSLNEIRYYGKLDFLSKKFLTSTLNYNILFGNYPYLTYIVRGRYAGFVSQAAPYLNLSLGYSVSKQFSRLKVNPHANIMLNKGLFPVAGLNLVFYPLANADLYFRTDVNYNVFAEPDENFVIKTEAGFRLWKFYFTGTYYFGKIYNFVEDDGYFIYNFQESILQQSALNIDFYAKNKTFFITLVPSVYEMEYHDDTNESISYSINYDKFLIKAGINIKIINSK